MVRAPITRETSLLASSPRYRLSRDTEADGERREIRESKAGELFEAQGPASVTTPLSASRARQKLKYELLLEHQILRRD